MYVIKLYYSETTDMEDIILCIANLNNVNKMFYNCVDELQKHFTYKFIINGLEATIDMKNRYLKVYVEEVNKKFATTDRINDIILKVNN